MALFLALVALAVIVSAINNTYADLGAQIKTDLSGSGSFIYWLGALIVIGFAGYIPGFRTPVKALLALIVLVFLLANGNGFISQLKSALAQGPVAPSQADTNVTAPAQGIPINITSSGGSGKSSGGSGACTALGIIGKLAGGLFGL